MKQLLIILTFMMGCHSSFAQQVMTSNQLYQTMLAGFGQYAYALDHNQDSIEDAKANFEIYLKVLRNKETQKLAEEAWDPWQVLYWLSGIYSKTLDTKEEDLIDFAFFYHSQHNNEDKTNLFYVVEPSFQYHEKFRDLNGYEQTANRLESVLSEGRTQPFLLGICKHFKATAYMGKKDIENAYKFTETAFELIQKEETAYRKTNLYQHYVSICGDMVQACILKGNYDKAWKVINQVEEGIKDSYTDKSNQYLALLATKIDIAWKMGKVSQTKGLVEQMETLIAKSKLIDKQYADFLSNGLNSYKQQLSLNSIASSTTPSAQNQYDTLLQKASQAVASNHLEEAKVYFQQALTEFEPTLDNVNILMYYSLISGYTSILLANYDGQEAISLIEHADSVIIHLNKLDPYADRYFKQLLGTSYYNLKENMLAKKYLEEAKRLYELANDHGSNYNSCLGSLIEAEMAAGDFGYAKLLINELDKIVNEAYKDDQLSNQLYIMQGILGMTNSMMGYKYEAKEQLEKAINNVIDISLPQMVMFRRLLAMLYMQERSYDKALEQFLKNYEMHNIYNERLLALRGIIYCLSTQHDSQVIPYLKEYNQNTVNNMGKMLQHSDKLDLQSYWENTMEDCVVFNNSLLQIFPDNSDMTKLTYNNTLYARLGLSEATKTPKTWSDVAKSLQPNEVAIEFVLIPEAFYEKHQVRYGALLLRNDYDAPLYIELCKSEEMDSIISNHIITDKSFINKIYDVKNPLIYDLVFKKLTKYLKLKDHIYYCPTNLMNLVNLGYLGDGKQRLSEKYDFHQVSSTALIASLKLKNFSCKGKAAIYGGVSYDESMDEIAEEAKRYQMEKNEANEIENGEANEMMKNLLAQNKSRGAMNGFLQGSMEEAMFIENLFKQNGKDVDLYVGSQANEESLKAYSGKAPQILHLSTHGFTFTTVNDQNEHRNIIEDINLIEKKKSTALLYSGLMMAGSDRTWNGENVPQGVEDGILTAYELSQLNLKGCDLTVLSACETGLGHFDTTGNEAGLKQALKQAGVGSIIFSLWQIPDVASSMLMQNFYQFILQGKQPREALQEAQAKVAKEFPEPYYWAGFSIID